MSAKPYLLIEYPNGEIQLAVSKDITLEEPSEYIPDPENNFAGDFNWNARGFFAENSDFEFSKKRKLMQMMITIDLVCSVALIVLSSFNHFVSDTLDTGYFVLYIVYGAIDIISNFIGIYSLAKKSVSGMTLFLLIVLILTGMSILIFSPLVLFHLLTFIIAIQIRTLMVNRRNMLDL